MADYSESVPPRSVDVDAPTLGNVLAPGTLIAGRFRIISMLGEGGMGVVYRAHQQSVDREVALKLLHSHLVQDANLLQRFQVEARAASRVTHPNGVVIYDFGFHDGHAFLAMEFVRGRDLHRRVQADGPLAPGQAAHVIDQVLAFLEELHGAGILHRDLKPENVFLVEGKRDRVKVVDFGLAKIAEDDDGGERLTREGTVFGTPQYMSPEQAAGEAVDARTDLYACGIMLYELITGQVPFSAGSTVGLLRKQMVAPVPHPSALNPLAEIDDALWSVLQRVLAKAREDRPENATAMRALLQPFLAGPPGVAAGAVAGRSVMHRPTGSRDSSLPVGEEIHRALPSRFVLPAAMLRNLATDGIDGFLDIDFEGGNALFVYSRGRVVGARASAGFSNIGGPEAVRETIRAMARQHSSLTLVLLSPPLALALAASTSTGRVLVSDTPANSAGARALVERLLSQGATFAVRLEGPAGHTRIWGAGSTLVVSRPDGSRGPVKLDRITPLLEDDGQRFTLSVLDQLPPEDLVNDGDLASLPGGSARGSGASTRTMAPDVGAAFLQDAQRMVTEALGPMGEVILAEACQALSVSAEALPHAALGELIGRVAEAVSDPAQQATLRDALTRRALGVS